MGFPVLESSGNVKKMFLFEKSNTSQVREAQVSMILWNKDTRKL